MVKKDTQPAKGKADKNASKDTFDPILIEASQAATVVLMLDSPEEEVVVKAAEAIYKFVEKCNVNKGILLDLEAVPRLLKLITSDSRLIRRNACLVLGSMSKHPNVSKLLKKLEVIPLLIKLLGPDEEDTVIEYAMLGLISLATYYSCKHIICELNGLEPLIRCLSSSDPDIQKNAIEALSLLLDDFAAKTAVRELNGFAPILELLKSEYAVIQALALKTLKLATEDALNRATLRDTTAITDLVHIVGHPTFSDIHVPAVLVLANMLLDFDSIELMKENGTMKRLMLITTDAPQPVEDEKKSKGKDKDKPSSPVKGAKGKNSAVNDDKQKSESSLLVVVYPSSADVKQQVAKAFRRAAKDVDSRRLLNEQEIEKLLIYLLNYANIDVQTAAAQAVKIMAENLTSRDAFGKLGGIVPVVKLLRENSPDVQDAAVKTLSVLTTTNEYNCHQVMKAGGIEPLIALLLLDQVSIIENTTIILTNMSAEDSLHAEIIRCGVIPALIKALMFDNDFIQCKITQAVGIFVNEVCPRKQFVAHSGVVPLVGLLSSPSKEVRSTATATIALLAVDEPTANAICQRGALDILRYMQISEDLGNAFVEVALSKLLNCSLSAKYALIGKLCATDIICDGFFDAGHMKAGKPLLPLAHYSREPVNHKRPIIYVNTGLSPCDQKQAHAPCEDTTTPPPSPYKDNVNSTIDIPADCRLVQMVCEVRELLVPLQFANLAERAIALAQFVSHKMGGPIERGSLSSFSWELPMSQLKFQYKSNAIPLGAITAGIHYHRALLFKVIGDRIGIPCSLVRGKFNRAWNELALSDEYEEAPIRYPPKTYVIDLIHEPGKLMRTDSADAITYCQP